MPTIDDIQAVARQQQTFGDLRPGFLEHESITGPVRPLSTLCIGENTNGRERSLTCVTIEMIEEVDSSSGERRFVRR